MSHSYSPIPGTCMELSKTSRRALHPGSISLITGKFEVPGVNAFGALSRRDKGPAVKDEFIGPRSRERAPPADPPLRSACRAPGYKCPAQPDARPAFEADPG